MPEVHRPSPSSISPTSTLHGIGQSDGEKEVAADNEKPLDTLPAPVIAGEQKTVKTKAALAEEKRAKRKYPGNEEGGKVLCKEDGKVYDQSLVIALSNVSSGTTQPLAPTLTALTRPPRRKTFFWPFWTSAIFLIISALLQTTAPQVTKVLLEFLVDSYAYYHASPVQREGLAPPKSAGYGIGIGFAIFAMQEVASLFNNQYMFRGMTTGMGSEPCSAMLTTPGLHSLPSALLHSALGHHRQHLSQESASQRRRSRQAPERPAHHPRLERRCVSQAAEILSIPTDRSV